MGIWRLQKTDHSNYSKGSGTSTSSYSEHTVKRSYIRRSSSATSNCRSDDYSPKWITNQYDGCYDDCRPIKPVTLPRAAARIQSVSCRRRPSLSAFDSVSPALKRGNSATSPDRFVAPRRPGLNASLSYRSNRDPQSLSKDEKLLRHHDAAIDGFNPRRRVTSPTLITPTLNPRRAFSAGRYGGGAASALTFMHGPPDITGERRLSIGTIWAVGGVAPLTAGVPDGRGGLLGSGTNAPLYNTSFCASKPKEQQDMEMHENRIAQALDIDRVARILDFRDSPRPAPIRSQSHGIAEQKTAWAGSEWILGGPEQILDAPNLRDDFYCSILAYSASCHTLAVGLGTLLYAWSEKQGVHLLHGGVPNGSHLTTLGFSSTNGHKNILASGRSDGTVSLMSLNDVLIPRFELPLPAPVDCLTWKPFTTMRASRCPTASPGALVKTEDLVIGDEVGRIYYYAVEWPDSGEATRTNYSGSITLLLRIQCHTQQICGLSFSCDGSMLASGGNDNLCCLFQTNIILQSSREVLQNEMYVVTTRDGRRTHQSIDPESVVQLGIGSEKHRWTHGAAVKAISFCPWKDGLVATGGGSNDKCIHFYHTYSGACLATINVTAQVTSLIWSTTRREIVATFGYAQPDHPYRIAVFSWPDCKQVAAIPWETDHRALYAIAYPGGPNENSVAREGGRGMSRTAAEGCIVVASSDESVKFHEVWASSKKATAGCEGLLGGSDILEGMEGVDREGDVIR